MKPEMKQLNTKPLAEVLQEHFNNLTDNQDTYCLLVDARGNLYIYDKMLNCSVQQLGYINPNAIDVISQISSYLGWEMNSTGEYSVFRKRTSGN